MEFIVSNFILSMYVSNIFAFSQILMGADGHIHIISGDGLCRRAINIEKTSVVSVMLSESGATNPGILLNRLTGSEATFSDVNLLVATLDGSILSLKQTPPREEEMTTEQQTVVEDYGGSLHFLHTNTQVC